MKKITIIGNGAAGTTAAAEIRKRDSEIPVEIISREDINGYNRPMLTKTLVSGVDEKTFYIKPEGWYIENNISTFLNDNVDAIDPESNKLIMSDGTQREYDRLIIATGAEAFVPPIPGSDLDGVFSVRSLKDNQTIHDHLSGTTDAVVIGGGVLGLEAAWDIKKTVDNVTVLERTDGLMSRQLDDNSCKALKNAADEIGISVTYCAETDSIVGENGRVTGVKLKSGEVIKAQLVIISTGIRQNTDLLKNIEGADVEKSIIVNDKMETGIPNIYAIGDCAESGGANFGIWPQAMEMAKTAVANIFGEDKRYVPVIPANMVGLSNIKIYAVGDNGKNKDVVYDIYEKTDSGSGSTGRFYFVDDQLAGGTLIGDISKLMKLQAAYKDKKSRNEVVEEFS